MAKPLRIGIVGSGFAANFHLASYRKVYGENFEVAVLCGRNREQCEQLALRYRVPHVTSSLEDLWRDEDLDAVDICVPNHLHAPLVLAAASHGKHIICEKPLGGYFGPPDAGVAWRATHTPRQSMFDAALEQIALVKEAVQKSGVTFCYGENWVYAPPIAKADRLMSASQSVILRIEGEESHSGSHSAFAKKWRTSGGGSLARLCVHPIGAALHLKQQEGRRRNNLPIRPAQVWAQTANLGEIAAFARETPKHIVADWEDVEDFACVIVTFEDGAIAQLTSTDTRIGGIRNYLTVHGSRAQVTANINPNDLCKAYTPDTEYFRDEYIVEKAETKAGWSFPAPDEDLVTGYSDELRDFVSAIAKQHPPKSDLTLACDVQTIVYAGYLSAELGRPIDLKKHLI